MIYTETILDDNDIVRIERQKNSPTGEWYSVWLSCRGNSIADSSDWIATTLPTLSNKKLKKEIKGEINIKISDQDLLLIRKVVKKATKLGWFDEMLKTVEP